MVLCSAQNSIRGRGVQEHPKNWTSFMDDPNALLNKTLVDLHHPKISALSLTLVYDALLLFSNSILILDFDPFTICHIS